MRRLLISSLAAGLLMAAIAALEARGQTPNPTTNFTTGFTPKNLKFVPIDTSKTMRQYGYNNPNFLYKTATQTRAFNLGNMLPRINLPGSTSTRIQTPIVPPNQNPYQRIFTPGKETK